MAVCGSCHYDVAELNRLVRGNIMAMSWIPRCSQCVFWRGRADGDGGMGECKYLRAGEGYARYLWTNGKDEDYHREMDTAEEPFSTHADFGCVFYVDRGDD